MYIILFKVLHRIYGTCFAFRIKLTPSVHNFLNQSCCKYKEERFVNMYSFFFFFFGSQEFFVLALTLDFHTWVGNRSWDCCVRLGGIAQTAIPTSAVGNEHVSETTSIFISNWVSCDVTLTTASGTRLGASAEMFKGEIRPVWMFLRLILYRLAESI